MRIHLDTDIGGDMDDLCALAMLLRWPGVEITGITTSAEDAGRRAGYVRRVLELCGRTDIPVAAGIDVASGRFRFKPGYPSDDRYWGGAVPPAPGSADEAIDLLTRSADLGAVIVSVGPFTNLAAWEERHPGSLAAHRLVLMGGHIFPCRPGYPKADAEMDFNLQSDIAASRMVLTRSTPTLVPLERTLETALRRAYIPALRSAGPVGDLIARQAEATDADWRSKDSLGTAHAGIPDDTVNFLHDPLACAIACGWRTGVRIERVRIAWEAQDGVLHGGIAPDGAIADVVTSIDGAAFSEEWLRVVCTSAYRARGARISRG